MTTVENHMLSIRQSMLFALFLLLASTMLTSCEKSNQYTVQVTPAATSFAQETVLEGIVTDDHGPVKSGEVRLTDSKNKALANTAVSDKGRYSITVPANTPLPVLLVFSADLQSPKAEKFISAVVYTNITQYDINPRTTAIARSAKAMGGYTHDNLILAAENAASVPDANKTTAGFRGDPTKQYGGWH